MVCVLTGESEGRDNPPGGESAEEGLARLSPHRTHESNWFKALLCAVGLHRWYCPSLKFGSHTRDNSDIAMV